MLLSLQEMSQLSDSGRISTFVIFLLFELLMKGKVHLNYVQLIRETAIQLLFITIFRRRHRKNISGRHKQTPGTWQGFLSSRTVGRCPNALPCSSW
jgi:hypothetical protein